MEEMVVQNPQLKLRVRLKKTKEVIKHAEENIYHLYHPNEKK